MQQGELTVTGHDYYIIALRGLPAKVEAHFKDHALPIPCNPHHHDELDYSVHKSNKHHGGFDLKISWSVSGVREIVWRVSY
jgi:hypothetical protein